MLGDAAPQPDAPLILIGRDGRRRVVLAADAAAQRAGLRIGMPASKAQALVPNLVVRDAEPDADREALDRLALWALRRYAPIIAVDPPHGLVIDATGATHLHSGESAMLTDMVERLINVVNDRFGTDFNQADQLFFDQIVEAAISDAALKQAAAVNPGDKFELVFKNLLEALFVERMDQNEEIFARFMNDKSFQKVVTGWLSSEAYRKLRLPSPGPVPSDEAADANS